MFYTSENLFSMVTGMLGSDDSLQEKETSMHNLIKSLPIDEDFYSRLLQVLRFQIWDKKRFREQFPVEKRRFIYLYLMAHHVAVLNVKNHNHKKQLNFYKKQLKEFEMNKDFFDTLWKSIYNNVYDNIKVTISPFRQDSVNALVSSANRYTLNRATEMGERNNDDYLVRGISEAIDSMPKPLSSEQMEQEKYLSSLIKKGEKIYYDKLLRDKFNIQIETNIRSAITLMGNHLELAKMDNRIDVLFKRVERIEKIIQKWTSSQASFSLEGLLSGFLKSGIIGGIGGWVAGKIASRLPAFFKIYKDGEFKTKPVVQEVLDDGTKQVLEATHNAITQETLSKSELNSSKIKDESVGFLKYGSDVIGAQFQNAAFLKIGLYASGKLTDPEWNLIKIAYNNFESIISSNRYKKSHIRILKKELIQAPALSLIGQKGVLLFDSGHKSSYRDRVLQEYRKYPKNEKKTYLTKATYLSDELNELIDIWEDESLFSVHVKFRIYNYIEIGNESKMENYTPKSVEFFFRRIVIKRYDPMWEEEWYYDDIEIKGNIRFIGLKVKINIVNLGGNGVGLGLFLQGEVLSEKKGIYSSSKVNYFLDFVSHYMGESVGKDSGIGSTIVFFKNEWRMREKMENYKKERELKKLIELAFANN